LSQAGVNVRRRWLFFVVGAIVFLSILLSGLSGFYIDLLWFREVRFPSVFWSIFWSRVFLGLVFGFLFFLLLTANLFIARGLTPRYRPFSPEQEMIERYRVALDPYLRFLIPAFAAFIAILVGIAASAQWETFVLWRAAGTDGNFGTEFLDPQFRRDPSFYIFILPFQQFVQGWLFSALVGVTLITAGAHYATGGIRLQAVGEKVTPQVKAHLSVLLGLIVLVKAWGYWLGRFDLLVSPRGVVTGASYTDVAAQLPALTLLVFIAIACALLFLVNIRFRGWALPVIGIGLLALTSIVAGAIVPAVVQRFSVDPQEFQREEEYIERNITATRQAHGLDRIEVSNTTVAGEVTADDVSANQPTIDNVRLWDPAILQVTYETLQRIQPYYEFEDVDVDRYEIDGERRVVMISAREVSQDGIPGGGSTWQNRHLFYTHGYGAVASPVNVVTPEGQPVFELADIPPPADAGIELDPDKGAQVYYGELSDVPYVVVGTEMNELNYPASGGQDVVETTYSGEGGIPLGGYFRRLVFAYRYRDVNLLISGLINSESKILINRDVVERVRKAAPFLTYDRDPYAAIVDGRLVFILDAYTTTELYPYSERVDLAEATNGDLTGRVNYMRNSVKAVVDAYDGTVRFYVVDPEDPLIRVWRAAFPDLFTTEAPPESLREHFRYPENLLQVQALQFANYHVTAPRTFYSKENFWAIPNDPTTGATPEKLRPYYVMTRLPGETEEEFVLFIPFTPFDRPNMIAYVAARSDPEGYGELRSFEFPSGDPPDGPQQVFARINQDPEFARERTLLGQQGSRVQFGNLFIVPIEDAFLYVQPVFVISDQENAIPELKRVLVVNGGTVAVGITFDEALAASLGEAPPPDEDGEPLPPGDVAELIAEALEHFEAAENLLRQGDLAGYQREIEAAQALIQQANELAGGSPQPSPSPSP
jgi:uncharacterized membrane protein (UPF0182 family)